MRGYVVTWTVSWMAIVSAPLVTMLSVVYTLRIVSGSVFSRSAIVSTPFPASTKRICARISKADSGGPPGMSRHPTNRTGRVRRAVRENFKYIPRFSEGVQEFFIKVLRNSLPLLQHHHLNRSNVPRAIARVVSRRLCDHAGIIDSARQMFASFANPGP